MMKKFLRLPGLAAGRAPSVPRNPSPPPLRRTTERGVNKLKKNNENNAWTKAISYGELERFPGHISRFCHSATVDDASSDFGIVVFNWGVSLRRLSSRHRISSIFPHNFTSRSFLDHLVRESEPVLRIFFSPMQRDGRFKRRLCRAFSINKNPNHSMDVSRCFKNTADKSRDAILPIQM